MSPETYPHVLIAGAGLSGLAFAQMLRKHGVSYSIFERDQDVEARAQGWAIALHGPVLEDLPASMPEDLGPIEQVNHLTPLDHLLAQFVFYDTAKPGMRAGVNDDASGRILRANRQRLRDWLLQHLPVQYGRRVVRVAEHDKVVLHFEDGSSETGDVLVGAEGSRSVMRRHILGGGDVMKPLPVGSLVGEVELSGRQFEQKLELGHSAYIVLDPQAPADVQCSFFPALNKVSPDGKTGYYYFILHWVDKEVAKSTQDKPYWTVTATRGSWLHLHRDRFETTPAISEFLWMKFQ